MKSATIIRNTLLTSQMLSPMIGSSAFVVGMRSRSGQPPAAPTALSAGEEDCEFDFIAAATQAAVEREAREELATESTTTSTTSLPPLRSTTTTPPPTSFEDSSAAEDDFVFDFIAAATQAAVEREARGAELIEADDAETPTPAFAVYPAFAPRTTAVRTVGETRW